MINKLKKEYKFMECGKKIPKTKNELELNIRKCKKRKNIDCNYFLKKKIKTNMKERKIKGWSKKQAIAISYSQIKRFYPICTFKRNDLPKKIVRIKVEKGSLHGYSLKLKLSERRKILNTLVNIYGLNNIVKKLNVLYVFNKNRYPNNAMKFRRDMQYIQKIYN